MTSIKPMNAKPTFGSVYNTYGSEWKPAELTEHLRKKGIVPVTGVSRFLNDRYVYTGKHREAVNSINHTRNVIDQLIEAGGKIMEPRYNPKRRDQLTLDHQLGLQRLWKDVVNRVFEENNALFRQLREMHKQQRPLPEKR